MGFSWAFSISPINLSLFNVHFHNLIDISDEQVSRYDDDFVIMGLLIVLVKLFSIHLFF